MPIACSSFVQFAIQAENPEFSLDNFSIEGPLWLFVALRSENFHVLFLSQVAHPNCSFKMKTSWTTFFCLCTEQIWNLCLVWSEYHFISRDIKLLKYKNPCLFWFAWINSRMLELNGTKPFTCPITVLEGNKDEDHQPTGEAMLVNSGFPSLMKPPGSSFLTFLWGNLFNECWLTWRISS